MRKIFSLIFLLVCVGTYLHYVQGWDFERLRREPSVAFFFPEDASATTTPIGKRGTGTHWETARPMPSSRADFGAAVVGNTIYVVGGLDGFYRTLNSALAYDIGADAWRAIPDLPQSVHHPAVVSDGKRVFVIGGLTGLAARPMDDVFAFDPIKNSWEQLGRLNDFRGAAAAASLDGVVYIIGGNTTAGSGADMEYYDASRGVWNGLHSMSASRSLLAAASADGRIYAVGGSKGSLNKNLGTTEIFDLSRKSWEIVSDMLIPRSGHAAVAVDGRVYVLGGESKMGTIAEVESFNPQNKSWSTLLALMPSPRHGLAAIAWKNRIYTLGGGRRPGFSVSDLNEVLIIGEIER
jgi:N-acetylneuraminic acid mutarotase